jgi:hypothetical protein
VDWKLSERLSVSGGAGIAWLSTSGQGIDQQRTAPAFRGDISGSGSRFAWNAGYRRAFLPSFGFGGTFQNEELHGSIVGTLTRRIEVDGGFAWRTNQPLVETDLRPHSLWARGSIGYLANRWMRIEGFYTLARQDNLRLGGKVNRVRVGVLVVTSKRMRLR